MRQLTARVAYALGMSLSPVLMDPMILWMYVGLSVGLALTGVAFWMVMGHYDRVDEELNTLNLRGEGSGNQDEEAVGEEA